MNFKQIISLLLISFSFWGGAFAAEHELYKLMQYGKENDIPAIKDIVNKNPKTLAKKGEAEPSRYTNLTPIFFISQTRLDFLKKLFSEVPEFKKYLNGVPGEKPYNFTPLVYFLDDSSDIIDFLISQGADINALQNSDKEYIDVTLLHMAINKYFREVGRVKENELEEKKEKKQLGKLAERFLPTIKLLLEKGIDPRQKAKKIVVEDRASGKYIPYENVSSLQLAEELKLQDVIDLIKPPLVKSPVDQFASALATIK